MNNEIKILFDKLHIDSKYLSEVENAEIKKVEIYEDIDKIKVIMKNDTNLSLSLYDELLNALTSFFGGKEVFLNIEVDFPNNDYFRDYFDKAVLIVKSSFPIIEIFTDRLINDNDRYYVEVINSAEVNQVNSFIGFLNKTLKRFGYNADINLKLNEEKRNDIKEKINNELKIDPTTIVRPKVEEVKKEKVVKKVIEKGKVEASGEVLKGRAIKDGTSSIKEITEELDSITIDGCVFGVDTFEPNSKEFKIITLKVTDYSDSIITKTFTRADEEYLNIIKKVKVGSWVRLRGYVKSDKYSGGELVFNVRDMSLLENKKKEERVDTYPRKRIELHAHTKMSDMDGVVDEVDLVKRAIKWGHPGLAITDHDCCQAFPHVFSEVTKYNKSLKAPLKDAEKALSNIEKELEKNPTSELEKLKEEAIKKVEEEKEILSKKVPFKAIYGTELEMSENYLDICFNKKSSKMVDTTFVVFDVETTGFNAGISDSMIEIGAVKVKNGMILEERFDELINPGHHIDEAITNLTGISDYKVKDADNEENVVKRFKEYIGEDVLVAHNARFDKSMLDMAYYKYDLGKLENPVVDTMMLSRVINKDLKRHSLSALTKHYKIDMDEVDEDEDSVNDAVNSSDNFDNNFEGIDKILVDDKVLFEDGKLLPLEFEEETEVNLSIQYKKSDITSITNYGSRSISLKPGKNEVEIKYVEDDTEKDVTLILNKVRSHHRADYDAEKTAEMFLKMVNQIPDLEDLDELGDVNFLSEKMGLTLDPNETIYENIPKKTVGEKVINDNSRTMHINILTKTKEGLKNLFKLISYANTGFLVKTARIPRRIIDENRDGLLVGSTCVNGEIFETALMRSREDLIDVMKWYDYIEVQPPSNYRYLLRGHDINTEEDIYSVIKKIIDCAKECGKIVVASGDVHNLDPEDLIYREIIVNQNSPARGRHPLAKYLNVKSYKTPNDSIIETLNNVSTNEYGNGLSYVEEKVLKIIMALTEFKDIPITRSNIIDLYQPEKNSEEEIFRKSKTGEELKEQVLASLRKFETRGFVKTKYDSVSGNELYVLNYPLEEVSLNRDEHIPNQYFRTTDEMMEEFSFLGKELAEEIVIDNPKKILDMVDSLEVIEYPEVPYSPIIEDSQKTVTDMVYDKAESLYGSPLPYDIEERISKELYGDCALNSVMSDVEESYPDLDKESSEFSKTLYEELHKVITSGYDKTIEVVKNNIRKSNPDLNEEDLNKELQHRLGGVIGGGFDVIYLIAQKLVKHSNDDGYLVGSRGSVGSSFVATMMGITEVNPLPAHYLCPKCHHSIFKDEEGNSLGATYSSGFDLPDKMCPKCGEKMNKDGQDMPFATFLGFNADKVPDIDLNFSGDNQASAHEYTKELFGTDNVYRAGTIGTVADKTAYGFVQGFEEEKEYNVLKAIMNSYNIKPPSKDELAKKKGLIKCKMRSPEVERVSYGCTGVKRTTGQHPGGIVVVPDYKDVFDFTPFQYPANDSSVPWRTTHFDYHAIDQDLLKLDILGHDDPTVLRHLQDLSKERVAKGDDKNKYPLDKNGEIDITCVPLDDKDTMSIFSSPNVLGVTEEQIMCPTGTLGVPEFGTKFVIQMLTDTRPKTFSELIKISGLSHGTDVWLGNAQELIANNIVPFKEVIGCRDDIMVYLSYHGVEPLKAFKIMEFVRKGKASKEPDTWISWKQVMLDANIEPWFIDSCQKIKYMFPKAHAAAYVISAFRIAWYKVHHPLLYYAAYLSIRCAAFDIDAMTRGYDAIKNKILEINEKGSSATNKEKETIDVLQVCLEATARGIKFKNIDINKSDGKYFVIDDEEENTLIIPFVAMDGLGGSVASGIVQEREKQNFISIEDLQQRGHVSKTLIEKMTNAGILDGMNKSNQLTLF